MKKSNFSLFIVGIVMTIFGFMPEISHAASSTATTKTQAQLTKIQSRGSNEITQRLTELSNLNTQVSNSTKLNASDKSTLSTEIASEIDGLTSLKTQLLVDTTVSSASTDEASIFSNYRVYAVIIPKVQLLTITDNQQNNETKLTSSYQVLEAKIATAETAGKNVSSISGQLAAMNSLIASATSISGTIRSDVLPIIPSSWNSNHSIFSGDRNQLNQAYNDNVSASKDAVSIAAALKSLK